MIGYGVLRIITEQFWRLPDAHLKNPRPYGLTYGQWLSALMVAVGVVALFIIMRRGGERVGGWGRMARAESN
jgi:prolipoprotein diacylglyceryltransferase